MFRLFVCVWLVVGGLFLGSCGSDDGDADEGIEFVVPDMTPNPVVQIPCVCDGRNCWGDCD